MSNNQEIRTGRHCVFNMHVHLVFVTKYRRGVFTKQILDDLRVIFEHICLDFQAKLIEFDGEEDHVHLLIHYPPKVAISKLEIASKGFQVVSLDKSNIQALSKNYGVMHFGHRVTLLLVVVAHLSQLSSSTLNNKIHHINISSQDLIL